MQFGQWVNMVFGLAYTQPGPELDIETYFWAMFRPFFEASRIAQYHWLMLSGHSGQYPVVENNIEIEISNGISLQIINQEQ